MSDNKTKFEQLCAKFDALREELGVPGAVVGITIDGETFTHGSGITSAINPLEIDEDTLFQIGSITKTFTATAMMRLVEDGKLDLNAPIRTYLPDFRVKDEAVSEKATIKHLITHSTGWIGDVFTDTGDNDNALEEYVKQMATLDQLAPPDFTFSYNNSAFCTAGRVIEAVTGLVYETAMKQLIFEPLGLDHTFFFPKEVMTYRFVMGHRVDDEQGAIVQRPWPIPRSSNPAGGIASSIKNLLAYGQYHLGDGSPLLKRESLDMMQTPQFPINDQSGAIGLSWFVRDVGGTKVVDHGGSTLGQQAQLTIFPEHNLVMGVLTNADKGSKLNSEVEKWVMKDFLGVEEPEPEAIQASPEELQPYLGTYSRPTMDTELKYEDDKLIMQLTMKNGGIPSEDTPPPPPPATLQLCGVDQMVVIEGPFKDIRLDFIRNEEDEIAYVRLGLRINPRVTS
ncbi:beta-lactamase family protein [Phototrophicus methaneseepsis]|uniref:Beta-lactamase family protein n=1 Tax=Phototrophicus methaneseepsis TaxID=2710758 RepID=A0A7S8IGD1_9CHLR|nr:serine hydrolase domain-containing protein [Phototrophicus methaneseepsis]QPC84616.1 beta-lactamase family protein [Phototrophicus methaneseepsis]